MKLNRFLLRVDELERRENPSVATIDVPIDQVPTIVTCYAAPPDVSIDRVPTIVTCYAAPSDVPIDKVLIDTVPISPPIPPPAYEIYKDDIVVGAIGSGSSRVRSFKPDGTERLSFNAFESSFTGGITVAIADFNGDGVEDIIVAAGAGGGPRVIGFDGLTGRELFSFYAFDADYRGGVSIAIGEVNFLQSEPFSNTLQAADIIVGSLNGSSHVKVFDGITRTELSSFYAFDGFQGGVNVASTGTFTPDVDGDHIADIIVGMQSGGSYVKVFSGKDGSVLSSFMAFDAGYEGGVSVAAGDLDYDPNSNDRTADIVVGSLRNGNHVKAFSGRDGSELASFFASDSGVDTGVNVAVFNNNLNSFLVVGSRKGSNVTLYRSNLSLGSIVLTKGQSLSAFESEYLGGVSIASSVAWTYGYL